MALTSGDVVAVRFGSPAGNEAGFDRPGVVVTAQGILEGGPSTVLVVPLTTSLRGYESEVELAPDGTNGLDDPSAAQCQHLRSVSVERIGARRGNVGAQVLAEVREVLADLLDLPG